MRAYRRLRIDAPGFSRVLLLLLALAAPLSAAAQTERNIDLVNVPCAPLDELAATLQRLLADQLTPADTLTLRVDPHTPGTLRVHLTRPPATYDRVLTFAVDDCPGIPHVVAAIVRGWVRQSWREVAQRAADLDAPSPPSPAVPAVRSEPEPSLPARRWRIAATAGVYSALGSSAQHGPSFSAGAGLDLSGSFGVALLLSFDSTRASPLSTASISVDLWQAAALARYSVPVASGQLELLAGPALQVLDARLTAPSVDRRTRPTHPAAVLAACWAQPLTPSLALVAALAGATRAGPEIFYVRNPHRDFVVPAAHLTGSIGARWTLK